ncbi:MAG: hypothetical protein FWB85_02380 [Chitinispirillia bacterium]|nr:hypothetical protein [Chitinispirillia bacterium]
MMKIAAYFIFPNKDDDLIALGDDPTIYDGLIDNVVAIKQLLKNHQDFELCYDAKNLNCFLKMAKNLLKGKYLDDFRTQILHIFGKRSRNIDTKSISSPAYKYINWDIASWYVNNGITCWCAIQSDKIIADAAEVVCDKSNKTILVNIANAHLTGRDAIYVIKDTDNIDGSPKMITTPIVNGANDFADWYAFISNTGFSLKNNPKFEKTAYRWEKQCIYRCLETGYFWYFDYFHKKNKRHYEVFDSNGAHLGEADECGQLKDGTKNKNYFIRKIIS